MSNPINSTALVIVTFNRCEMLSDMLDSISKMSTKPDIVYIIDNNSSDHTNEIVLNFKNRDVVEVVYHNTGFNAGGAGGFSVGTRMAYDAGWANIWLADDDITIDQDCLTNLTPFFDSNTILQPMRFNMDGSCAEISAVEYDLSNPFYLRPKRKTVIDIFKIDEPIYNLKSIPFEGPLIPREIFTKIGFPDERFFIFNDDLDFSIKALNAGFDIKCISAAKINRKIPFVQSVALKSWKGYFMFRNYFRIQKKYGAKPAIYLRILFVFILALGHSLVKANFKSAVILVDALRDGMSKNFKLNEKYKP